ncbi:MAG TPA: PLP-dependent aspartate aminotransferase family protein [Steroidobacteraceae bacterium]
MKKETLVNHPPRVDLPPENRAVVAPIYQTVKFEFEDLEQTLEYLNGGRQGFFYTRASNPTARQLELTLAQLQGREDCLTTSSGIGAMAQTLLALTKQGDHVLCFVETYGPTRYLVRNLLTRFGVIHTMLSIEDVAGVERTLASRPTRLLIFESPTNPVTKVADVAALTRLARAHGALTVLDNTFAGLHQHGQYDIDLFVHSLTKFASGAGDVMGGAVIARSELIRALRADFSTLGGVLDPHAAFLIQRGLKTYFARYRAQSATAGRIAELLVAHSAVERVHYPGLPSHPQYALARTQMAEAGSIVTFDLRGGAVAAARFVDALGLFALTPSLGSTESLVLAPQMMTLRDLSPEQRRISGIGPGTVRLAIGLEDGEDLAADVVRALEAAAV